MATPAEFPRIDPVRATETPDAVVRPREAQASDFGYAQGLDGLARGISAVGDAAQNIADDQARTWAATASAQQEVNVRKAWTDKVNSLDPSAKNYPEQIANLTQDASQTWDDAADAVSGDAPNGYATTLLRTHMAAAKARFQVEAMAQQSQLNAAYTSNLVQQGISADSDLVSASPDNDTFNKAATRWQTTIGGYKTIDPEDKGKLQDFARNQLANAQADGMIARNPGAFLASISPQGGITTTRGEAGQIPAIQNFNANYVKPFSAEQVQQVAQSVRAPSKYDALIDADAQKYGISRDLLKTILVDESHLNPKADNGVSHGIAQLTTPTARALGVDPTNPEQSIEGAARLLSQYQDKYGADPYKLALAYYGGPNPGAQGPNSKQYAANVSATLTYMGANGEPQVQPIPEEAIATAKPPLAGWDDLTWSEKVGYVRKAEAKQGQALSEARGKLTAGLTDAMASLKQGVTPPNITDPQYSKDNMIAVLGPDRGQRAYVELNFAKQTAANMQMLATMPKAQRDALVQKTFATAQGVGAESNYTMANNLAEANDRVNKAIAADGMGYAVQTHIGGAAPIDWSTDQSFIKSLSNRQAVMQALTKEYGAKPAIFSEPEAQQISARIDSLKPQDRLSFMVSMRRALTDDRAFNVAMNQVAKQHPAVAGATYIAMHGGSVHLGDGTTESGTAVASKIMEGDYILNGGDKAAGTEKDMGDLPKPNGKGALGLSTTKFDEAYNRLVPPQAFAGGDAVYQSRVAGDFRRMALDYYVADARHRGLDVSQPTDADIQRAVNAVTGGVTRMNRGVLFAPRGMDPYTFADQFETRAKQALKSAGYDEKYVDANWSGLIPTNLRDGMYGFLNGGQVLRNKAGTADVIVNYADALPPDLTPPENTLSNTPLPAL